MNTRTHIILSTILCHASPRKSRIVWSLQTVLSYFDTASLVSIELQILFIFRGPRNPVFLRLSCFCRVQSTQELGQMSVAAYARKSNAPSASPVWTIRAVICHTARDFNIQRAASDASSFFLSLFNTVPLHSLKYNSQRLNRRTRG